MRNQNKKNRKGGEKVIKINLKKKGYNFSDLASEKSGSQM